MDRDETIKRIKAALEKRSGKKWSVTHGRGTASCWLHISSPPKRRDQYGMMTEDDHAELTSLLGLSRRVGSEHESIPASDDYYQEYVDRAEGREPSVIGEPYWD